MFNYFEKAFSDNALSSDNRALAENSITSGDDFARLSSVVSNVMQETLHVSAKHKGNKKYSCGKSPKMKSGISELDKLLGELMPGGFYSILGRPGMGKTALILDMILNISALSYKPIYYISLRESKEEIVTRLIQKTIRLLYSGINNSDFENDESKEQIAKKLIWKTKELSHSEIDNSTPENEEFKYRLGKCWNIIESMNLFLYDKAPCQIAEIKALIEKNVHDGIIFIDCFQLFSCEKDINDERVLEAIQITKCLKQLSTNIKIPIVITAGLSRQIEGRADRRPRLNDIRDYGTLLQDSDAIIFIYRNGYYNYHDNQSTAELNLAKNRFGETGVAVVKYDAQSTTFIRHSSE